MRDGEVSAENRGAASDGPPTRVGIVGAGVAGVGAAYALRNENAAVTLLEKSGGVCGRAATRRKHGCRYDHGANYLKDADDRTASLIPELGTEGLVDIEKPVWTFDAEGTITPGEDRAERKWTWTEGITQLAKRILERTDATVHRRTRIDRIERNEPEAWTLIDGNDEWYGPFDALVLTPPAPQTAALLRSTAWDDDRIAALVGAIESVPYRTIRTLMFNYQFRESYPWYALVNTDTEHDVGWLSREECKRGHVPDGESLLIAQMSPAWSSAHYDDPLEPAAEAAADRVASLLGDDRYRDPDWIDDQGWRYALPDAAADAAAVRTAEDAGLYVAGDWVVGEGRVPAALWNGHDTAERISSDHT